MGSLRGEEEEEEEEPTSFRSAIEISKPLLRLILRCLKVNPWDFIGFRSSFVRIAENEMNNTHARNARKASRGKRRRNLGS